MLKYSVQCSVFVLVLLCACSSNRSFYKNVFFANDEAVSCVGRFDFSTPEQPKVWAPGAYITFRFKGSFCDIVIFDENKYGIYHNYISISVDDQPAKRILLSEVENYIHVTGPIRKGIHRVLICKDTESGIGYIQFGSIRCKELKNLKRKKKKLIEFIGDSITCGNGCDTTSVDCGEGLWSDQHNAYESYGPKVARRLNADWMLSAVSGIGITRSCCGTNYTLPDVYTKIDFNLEGEQWNFKRLKPYLVCITLGQNDGLQNPVLFCNTYKQFIKRVRYLNPKAIIVVCSSPMANKELTAYHRKYIPIVVKQLKKAGMRNCYPFLYANSYRGGCGNHPSMSEHSQMAIELARFLTN